MVEQATVTTIIEKPPARCYEVAADIAGYPQWAADIKEAAIDEVDEEGRASLVTFRAAAMGRSTTYTLRYDYSAAPRRLAWVLEHGDITRKLDGWYEMAPIDGDPSQTEVTYHLEVDLIVPLPGFVKRRAEGRIMHTALAELKAFAESG